jgi:putative flippase GtrA
MIPSQFARYVLVGSANTALSYFIYAFLLWLGMAFQWANLCALIGGILAGFSMQSHFVFANNDWSKLGPYTLLWGALYVSSILIILLLKRFGLNDYIAGLIAMVPVVVLSFILQKVLIFRKGQR